MKFLDLAQPIFDGCPNCPVHPRVQAPIVARHETDGWHMEHLSLTSHTGSHLDAPLHKIAGGRSIDTFPLEAFAGAAFIVDLRNATPDQPIGAAMLEAALPANIADHIILLATSWGQRRAVSEEWLHHSPYLAPDGAEFLVQKKARAVGIDHFSIGGMGEENTRTHEILLGAEMWIVEDLIFPDAALSLLQPVSFMALPIYFKGFSGSFCRPVLVLP